MSVPQLYRKLSDGVLQMTCSNTVCRYVRVYFIRGVSSCEGRVLKIVRGDCRASRRRNYYSSGSERRILSFDMFPLCRPPHNSPSLSSVRPRSCHYPVVN